MLFFHKPGIVNVKMIITEEKILSNIDKVQKMINPNNKKQIIQLEDDAYFKDLIDSIKTYLIEYPKKKNFPYSVYKAAYGLVEFATNQFEENTKQIENLIRQRENNIAKAAELKEVFEAVESKDKEWKTKVKQISNVISEDIVEALVIVGKTKTKKPADYDDAVKLIKARISNLESNLHIEIDMERIEDRSKALSYIGIEVAEALKGIPTPIAPVETAKTKETKAQIPEATKPVDVDDLYYEETTFEVKPSLWQRIKNSKLVRALSVITKIRIRLDVPALPEGRGDNH
ncbi:MAG: hypothetical protein J5507_05320 [Clostridia bacterium]|nr:hypothetical protein [Clostridia bacterium]